MSSHMSRKLAENYCHISVVDLFERSLCVFCGVCINYFCSVSSVNRALESNLGKKHRFVGGCLSVDTYFFSPLPTAFSSSEHSSMMCTLSTRQCGSCLIS